LILQFFDLLNKFVDRVFWHFSTPSFSTAGRPIGRCASFVSLHGGCVNEFALACEDGDRGTLNFSIAERAPSQFSL
jgi:hypothetical protein